MQLYRMVEVLGRYRRVLGACLGSSGPENHKTAPAGLLCSQWQSPPNLQLRLHHSEALLSCQVCNKMSKSQYILTDKIYLQESTGQLPWPAGRALTSPVPLTSSWSLSRQSCEPSSPPSCPRSAGAARDFPDLQGQTPRPLSNHCTFLLHRGRTSRRGPHTARILTGQTPPGLSSTSATCPALTVCGAREATTCGKGSSIVNNFPKSNFVNLSTYLPQFHFWNSTLY